MTRVTVTMLDEQRRALRALLFRDDLECAALVLCGTSSHTDPWTGTQQQRFLVHKVVEVPLEHFTARTADSLTWSTTPFFNQLKTAASEGLVVGVIHSHPTGPLAFSKEDDKSDQELATIADARSDGEVWFLSMVMDDASEIIARAFNTKDRDRGGSFTAFSADLVAIIGNSWSFRYPGRGASGTPQELDRQVRAFGRASTSDLSHLRITVVGCGGTGSAVALLLARIGVKYLAFVDTDTVHGTNLNRMHFSSRIDANLQRRKVDVVAEAVAGIGLDTVVLRLPYHVDNKACRDVLLASDLVFGCTDDHLGRNFLNRFAHFYLTPVVDLGLSIEPDGQGGYNSFDGRVTVVQPGYPCQHCRSLIDQDQLLAESQRRTDPALYRERRRAGYVVGQPDPSPVVVTFTTELAAMAVNELFQRLNGFRQEDGWCSERVRRFTEVKDSDTVPAGKSRKECPLCGRRKFDGLGDVEPFLDQA